MADKVLDVSREQLLSDIADALRPFEPPAHWFTVKEMAELWGMGYHQAYEQLERRRMEGAVRKCDSPTRSVYYEVVSDG